MMEGRPRAALTGEAESTVMLLWEPDAAAALRSAGADKKQRGGGERVLAARSEDRKERRGKEWAATGGTLFIEAWRRWATVDRGRHAVAT
jgi:hypothetical protein